MSYFSSFVVAILLSLDASASYLSDNLNSVDSVESFKTVISENTNHFLDKIDERKIAADEKVTILLENKKKLDDKEFAKKLEDYTLSARSDIELAYDNVVEFLSRPFEHEVFFSKVIAINIHYDELISQSDSHELNEIINKKRVLVLDEFFASDRSVSEKLKNRHKGKLHSTIKQSIYSAEKKLDSDGISTILELVLYDNGNCGKRGVGNSYYISFDRFLNANFIDKINRLSRLSDKKLTYKCRKTTFSKPSLKYKKKKHVLVYSYDIDNPFDLWDRQERHPKEKLLDFIESL